MQTLATGIWVIDVSRYHRQPASGFTFIELLVVLVIIAIISSISIGAIRFFDEEESTTFQHAFRDLLALGIDEAILTGKVHGLFRQDNMLVLKKYARQQEKAATVSEEVEEIISDVFSSLPGNDEVAQSTKTDFADQGAFTQTEQASWQDAHIATLDIPEELVLDILTDQSTIDLSLTNTTPEDAQEEQAEQDEDEQAPQQNPVITLFWPGGFLQPSGSASIVDSEGQVLQVYWQTNAEISFEQ